MELNTHEQKSIAQMNDTFEAEYQTVLRWLQRSRERLTSVRYARHNRLFFDLAIRVNGILNYVDYVIELLFLKQVLKSQTSLVNSLH